MKKYASDFEQDLERTYKVLDRIDFALDTINNKLPCMQRASRTLAGRVSKTTAHKTSVITSRAGDLTKIANVMHVKNAQMRLPLFH